MANKGVKLSDYLKKAGDEGFSLIQMQDRKEVLDYFSGVLPSSN
jgi:hypothetical protein